MNKKNILPLSIRAAMMSTALLITTQAFAFPTGNQDNLYLFDTDSNGVVTTEEKVAGYTSLFNEADMDQSNTLSLEEFTALKEAARLAKISHSFTKLDSDNNDFISAVELSRVFPEPDAIKLMGEFAGEDAQLNIDEFTAMRLTEDLVDEQIAWEFAELDKNADGAIQYEEFVPELEDQPDVELPEEPEVDQPEQDEPEVDQPEPDEPEVDQPEPDQPEVDQPEQDEPEVDQPEQDEPEVDQPEADEKDDDESDNGIDDRISELTEKIEALTLKKTELEAQLETASGRSATRLERKLARLDERIQRFQTQLDELPEEAENGTDERIAELTQKIERLTLKKTELEAQLETATDRSATRLERKLARLDERIQRFQAQLDELQTS